mgnify:CR=1 FL=1
MRLRRGGRQRVFAITMWALVWISSNGFLVPTPESRRGVLQKTSGLLAMLPLANALPAAARFADLEERDSMNKEVRQIAFQLVGDCTGHHAVQPYVRSNAACS